MNRSTFSLFVAILIHLLIFMLLWMLMLYSESHQPKKVQKQEKKIKISLKELPKKHKKSGLTKQKIPDPRIAPPMPKGSQLKKIVKPKKQVHYKPKKKKIPSKLNKPKKSTKPPKKVKKFPKTEPIPPEKPYIPLLPKKEKPKKEEVKKETPENNDSLSWLYEDKSSQQKQEHQKNYADGGNISQDIKELYGEEFGKLSPGQQQYILDNQEIMRRITQQVLNRVARVNLPRDLHVNTYNVVEFYLHPNGDISDFKFLKKSGIYVLDDTTKETIEYAYSKYPRPKEKTLIRYNIFYHLASY